MATIVLEQQGKTRFVSKTVTIQAILEPKQEIGPARVEDDCEVPFDLVKRPAQQRFVQNIGLSCPDIVCAL